MSVFTELNRIKERNIEENTLYANERISLDFLLNESIKYEEPTDTAFYKVSFEEAEKKYRFDRIAREAHYDLMCMGNNYETGMRNGKDFKPYILVFYNRRNGVENGFYTEFIDRANKIKTSDVELVFTVSGEDLVLDDYGVFYDGQIIPLHQVNVICQFYNMRHETTLSSKVFYDDNKITFSRIIMSRIATNNGLITKQINKRIVMNIETGKTYKLNDYDLLAKKKTNLKNTSFRILEYNDKLTDNDIEIYKDYYVIVSKDNHVLNNINNVIRKINMTLKSIPWSGFGLHSSDQRRNIYADL